MIIIIRLLKYGEWGGTRTVPQWPASPVPANSQIKKPKLNIDEVLTGWDSRAADQIPPGVPRPLCVSHLFFHFHPVAGTVFS